MRREVEQPHNSARYYPQKEKKDEPAWNACAAAVCLGGGGDGGYRAGKSPALPVAQWHTPTKRGQYIIRGAPGLERISGDPPDGITSPRNSEKGK